MKEASVWAVFNGNGAGSTNVVGGAATLTIRGTDPCDGLTNLVMKAKVGGDEYMSARFTVFDMAALTVCEGWKIWGQEDS